MLRQEGIPTIEAPVSLTHTSNDKGDKCMKPQLFYVTFFLLICLLIPLIAAAEPVHFPDPNLRTAIESALNKQAGDPITADEMATLTHLSMSSANISNLTGLEHATNLTSLILWQNSISDISALEGLTNLTSLELWQNSISDISALEGLTNLTSLNLNFNSISDISALEGLTNLTSLELYNNSISDISALEGLTNLTLLSLHNNSISDISALEGLTNLTSLYLNHNSISDISALEGLTNLTSLSLAANGIADVSALVPVLSRLTNLTSLYLGSSGVADVSALVPVLSRLTNLTSLSLGGNGIADVSALSGFTNLTWLNLAVNSISDISALEGLTNLTSLYLGSNSISDISSLVANTGLGSGDSVDVRGNPLSYQSINTHIPTLQSRGVTVEFDNRTPTTLLRISSTITESDNMLVVEVRDSEGQLFAGVPVMFTVTSGGGTLSATNTTTDTDGRAESALTLGADGENTVSASVEGISETVTFSDEPEEGVHFPDLNLRAEIESALNKQAGDPITADEMATLTRLSPGSANISDLTGLEHATNLTWLYLHTNPISDISALEGLTNLTSLVLESNSISDISALEGLTNLTVLTLSFNSISDISALEGLTNLTSLHLHTNSISDISALEGLTNLTVLYLGSNSISDISALEGLTNLTVLDLWRNSISDISALEGLTNLTSLYLGSNSISDISSLVANTGLGSGDSVDVRGNPLSYQSINTHIPTLQSRGVTVGFDNRTPTTLLRISSTITESDNMLVVEVRDSEGQLFAGVPVMFTVTSGGGTLSATSTTTDTDGRAESALTLGADGENTVSASVEGISETVTFSDEPEEGVHFPDLNLRAEIESALNKQAGDPITEAEMATLTRLEAPNANISVLTGLEHATNLTSLDLGRNSISDISALEGLTNLRSLNIYSNSISDISALEGLTNLTSLNLDFNSISDISALEGLTNLTSLILGGNGIADVSALSGFTNLTSLVLYTNSISDISALEGLTNLTSLTLFNNLISDISALEGLTNLTSLDLSYNSISDISALEGLTNLTSLYLGSNSISDISSLVANTGLGSGDTVSVQGNPLSYSSIYTHIPTLQSRGVTVEFDNRTPTTLLRISSTITESDNMLVVEVRDSEGQLFAGVPVMFTVTSGGGTLSATSTTTDTDGRAESALTLGADGENTVSASVEGISETVTFSDEPEAFFPDPNLRTAIESALNKQAGDPITADEMATLTRLSMSSANISDLTGLEHATNLTSLDLGRNSISDISALEGLTNLTWLNLGSNSISDISALEGLTNLTLLYLDFNSISDISALEGLTNLTSLNLFSNSISDISALEGLTNLTWLHPGSNSISDISALEGLTNLTSLGLDFNSISDISALEGLTNLTSLSLHNNSISDISALEGLTNLTWLALYGNSISDISALEGLTNLTSLDLRINSISDISPLVANTGLGSGDSVDVRGNPLSYSSIYTHIPTLQSRGVTVGFDNRTPTTLLRISSTITESDNMLVVEVRDSEGQLFAGVPVMFTVTSGGGTLSVTSTTTDTDGRAESTLTLGADGENTVSASVEGISETVTFSDVPEPTVDIPDPNLRAAIESALNKQAGDPITVAEMATLTHLEARDANISVLIGLEHATNLTELNLWGNSISDISPVAGLTNLTQLYLNNNSISDISPLSGLTNLTHLFLSNIVDGALYDGNEVRDISSLAGLTNLTRLGLGGNSISDISAVTGLTKLIGLNLGYNSISDISAVTGLTNLTSLYLYNNSISDISPLVTNTGLGDGDTINVQANPLNYSSFYTHIPTLTSRGVTIEFDNRTPTTLLKISSTITESDNVLVVEVRDSEGQPFAGVPVTFAVTSGGGTLSATSPTTNTGGRAESTLTLGADGENTVSASVEGISETITFSDVPEPTVDLPDPNLRTAIETALNKQAGAPITAADMTNLTHLEAPNANISDLTGLEHATNLTDLILFSNSISDISVLSGLTNLTQLSLVHNSISDISVLSGLTNLSGLSLVDNSISDISALSGLTNLTSLYLSSNSISDIAPLVANTGLGGGDDVYMAGNPLSYPSIHTHIPTLQSRGVTIEFDNRTPTTLLKISSTITESNNMLVVEVRDSEGQLFAGVPVTFTVTSGGGTLSTTSTTTNTDGRAESTLTLGSDGENTVSASVEGISETITFSDVPEPTVDLPDPNLRTAIETALNKQAGAPITAADMTNLTYLEAPNANISDLTGLEHATNLTDLILFSNSISDISVLSGLTNLTQLSLVHNSISDISVLSGLTNLSGLSLVDNSISDISALSGLTNLTSLYLSSNSISDIAPLVANTGLGGGDDVYMAGNPLSYPSIHTHIPTLQSRGVTIEFDNRTPTTLLKISSTITESNNMLVVEVRDNEGQLFAGVPVTFTVTSGGGTLSTTSTTTDTDGRAESTLTLGADGENTVSASVEGISETVTFSDVPEPTVDIPDPSLRAEIESALNKQAGDPITATDMANLTRLEAPNANISNLTGLEHATNLTELILGDQFVEGVWRNSNSISDISPVAGLTNLTSLDLGINSISDISPVAGLTNLTSLSLDFNSISDISALEGLTNLTSLGLGSNSISDISALEGLTNLTSLSLDFNSISDISALEGLTNLTSLGLGSNSISDISALEGLTNLTSLTLWQNSISDISALEGLTNLTLLNLEYNSISDISSLVANTGLGSGDTVSVQGNPLSYQSINTHIPTLQSRGVTVGFDDQAHPALLKISGDNQQGNPGASLAQPFVVEVQDENGSVLAGVPVTFAITKGGGTLRATRTTTNKSGRAESTLTLGPDAGTNTVSVSAAGIQQTVTFNAEGVRTDVTIPVNDVNEAPMFADETAERSVDENTEAGEAIDDAVEATDADSDKLTYTLGGDDISSFGIDENTGQLMTMAMLDHETKASYMVMVTADDGNGGTDTINVTITVNNVNEAPMFASETAERSVDENTAADMIISEALMATDDDGDTLAYSLGGTDADSFAIDGASGQLMTKAMLDHETKDEYMVMVTASDGNGGIDTIDVTITVEDVNDAPMFADETAERSVDENFWRVAIDGAFRATDQDEGDTLAYSLDAASAETFDIDPITGQLQTKDALDFEDKASHTVEVIAMDTAGLTDSIIVTISVTNRNDRPYLPGYVGFLVRTVAENSAAGTNIGAPVTVTDPDVTDTNTDTNPETPIADTLSYILLADLEDAELFDIDEGTGQLKTKAPLDYETQTDYEVAIGVSDGSDGYPSWHLTIKVSDVTVAEGDTAVTNSAPIFRDGRSIYRVIAENTGPGVEIGDPLSAEDTDGNTLTYRFGPKDPGQVITGGTVIVTPPPAPTPRPATSEAASLFEIDSASGQLKTLAPLDYEARNFYQFNVTVTDDGEGLLTDTIRVTIGVEDVNEQPMFAGPTDSREIAENNIPDNIPYIVVFIGAPVTFIGAPVTAEDPDSFIHPQGGYIVSWRFGHHPLRYRLVDDDAGLFFIDSETGQLFTTAVLDHEATPSYVVTVEVSDRIDAEGRILNFPEEDVDDTIDVTITVTDVNEAPMFADETAGRSVDENTAADMIIGEALMATDPDDGAEVMYSLGGTDMASFAIDEMTGQLMTMSMLDHETKDEYTVMVTATDTGGLTDSITVTITVDDVNEAPMFADEPAERSVAENTAADMVIGDALMATDQDDGDAVTYSLGGTDMASFAIDSATGQLKTLAPLDYETKTDYEVTVIATDTDDLMDEITVTINVADVSVTDGDTAVANSAPAFDDGPSTTREIAENTAAGENIGNPVEAPDANAGDEVTYTLDGTDMASFAIDDTTGQLKTMASLDHETKDTYTVMVIATDTSSLTDSITVTISVMDINEAPMFDGETAERSVDENTAADMIIGEALMAPDPDAGDAVMYTLGGTDMASFAIDSATGQLKTMVMLDHETKDTYMVMVTADDGNGGTDTIDVTITVNDVNEAPMFADEPAGRSVAENTAADMIIGEALMATDPDEGDAVMYSLGGTDMASFAIDAMTGQLMTMSMLDHETKDTYMVMVTADDGNGGTDTIDVTITVNNVNEPPVFPATIDPIEVAENTAAGEDIGAPVAAMDVDSGDTWTYTLGGTDAASFDIVADSGQLQTMAELDYETQTDYEVTVIATDTAGLMDEITVTINVADVSVTDGDTAVANSAPAFDDGPSTTREIAENTAAGENIGNPVEAPDANAGDEVTYTLDGTDMASFAIDAMTAQLKTMVMLDHETKDTYTVMVIATDTSSLTDSITVTISVMDINEAPMFDGETAERSVDENTAADMIIGEALMAPDPDAGDTVMYTLGGTDMASFAIDSATGQLKTMVMLDHETKDTYMVMVTADDGNGGTDTIDVTITVNDVNEAPMFADEPAERSVAENTAAGEAIGSPVAATDSDEGDAVMYSLGGTDMASFAIDAMTGQLMTMSMLDHETKDTYMVMVTADDGNGGTDTIDVTITVNDVNEAPTFEDGRSVDYSIVEGASDRPVGSPTATDPDTGDTLTYAITSGNTDGLFAIDSSTGELATAQAVTPGSHSLTVTVTDSKADDGTADTEGDNTITVTITVTDDTTANNPPTFNAGSSVSYSIVEGASGRTVGSPTATDLDGDSLTYDISSGNTAGLFAIDNNGRLTTARAVTPGSHSLTVTVSDSKADDGTADTEVDNTITVSITVSARPTGVQQPGGTVIVTPPPATPGTTNNAPTFADGASTTREVAENTPAGQNIGSPVSATDPNGDTLTYALGGTDAASFDIDSTNGQLKTSAALDFETKSSYTVTVTANDGQGGTASITVTISVTDVSVADGDPAPTNTAPAFASATATLSVAENTAAGGNIGATEAATDSDTGDVLTYTLGGTDMASFDINAASGQLMTQAMLDHETKASYTVRVTATDKAGLTDSITVTITVTNVNEAPMFADETAQRSVDENTAADMMIGDALMATDPDADDELMYSLGGDDMESFAIDAATGQLMTQAMLDHETKDSYMVMVTATDKAGLTGSIMVTISVTDVNDAPMFASATAERMVAENTAAGMMIGDPLTAMDDDGDEVMYTLGGDDMGSFDIGADTGQLMTKVALDHETKASYMVMVTASDGTDMSSMMVTIMVTDVPEFMLTVPAGQSLIHIPLKMAGLAKISDLHEKLGGKSKVSNLITRDAAKGIWYSYLGPEFQARVGDRDLTDDLGILAVMKEEVTVQLSGDPLGTDGVSSIMLQAGTNLVGVPLKDSRITNVSDLLELEGIKDNVSYIIVSDGGEYRTVTRAGDPGDVAVTGGQSLILQATEAATVTITGDGWASSAMTAAPSISLIGVQKDGTTAVLAVTGSIDDAVKGLNTEGLRVTVKNLSTGKVGTVATSDDGVGYQLTFVDIETGRAAQIGDTLEISAQSLDPFVGVQPLRYVVTPEDVKRGHIQLDTLVTYEIPAKTELLRNYPNPFNPETWIPYRLAKDATVTLEIYDTTGGIVRNIHIGHQIAAIYESRSKAIYWDGRNNLGERVASGIYFYHLSAGDFSATRKMVILK